MGKLPTRDLKKMLKCIRKSPNIVVPPLPGYDSGVHRLDGDTYLVVSTDPCINVPLEWFGYLLIHYAASDVALFGATPEFCTINLLGPLSSVPRTYLSVMKQACGAAHEIGMAIVTGHTGTYDGLSTLVGVCTAYGTIDKKRLITPGGAKPGDYILCVKPLGLEIAANLSLQNHTLAERFFGKTRAKELAKLVALQSCVKEALALVKTRGVNAMHDATEGGLTAALNELAEASKTGFRLESDKIPIVDEVHALKKHFRLSDNQVLSMSSTGTILAAVNPEGKTKVETTLRQNGIEASIIGVFTKNKRRILMRDDQETPFPREADDPYARILSGLV
jgi:hydrogenase maturation factor